MGEMRFSGLQRRGKSSSQSSQKGSNRDGAGNDIRQQLSDAESIGVAAGALREGMSQKLASMFGLNASDVAPTSRLSELGVDSLVAVELRNWIAAHAAAEMVILELMQNRSLSELAEVIVKKSTLVDQALLA